MTFVLFVGLNINRKPMKPSHYYLEANNSLQTKNKLQADFFIIDEQTPIS